MKNYKNIELPKVLDFSVPIYVNNRNARSENTNAYFNEAAKEANSFPKIDGLVTDKNLVEFVACPICNSKDNKELFIKWGFRIAVCNSCEHVYVENQVKPSVLSDLYSSSEVDVKFQERSEDSNLLKYEILFYNKYLQFLQKKFNNNERLLDIGAGDGKFLEFLNVSSDYKLSAMEFSENSADFIKNIVGEDEFYNQAVSNTNFNGKIFKIITIWGVLEHMPNPLEELSKCKSILDKNGRVLVLVPNFYSRAFKILGVNNPTINPRSHLQYYSYNSFKKLATNAGFKIDEYFQELPVIDLMYEHITYSPKLVEQILKDNESYRSVYILKAL
jgi:2-polyprenyl-3-methyl-5-hydroxy-6-metoxy-1,4-benzoquinol methylase